MRYERKYFITDYSYRDVEQLIKFHPACFTEIFHERVVNNIYFDTFELTHYYDNIEGSPERMKVRIRWYGELFGKVEKPVLEFKIKNGLLGKKESYNLNPFVLNKKFTAAEIEIVLQNNSISSKIKNEVLSLNPLLLNSYTRKYFISQDKLFRITIDHHLNYYKINNSQNAFATKTADYYSTILELKYDVESEEQAKEVSTNFPFMLTKNSKYLQGLQSVSF